MPTRSAPDGPHPAIRAARRHPYLALILLSLLLWMPGFFTIPPSDRDESRFVQGTKQMLETGNFVEIRNGTEARNRKPIGIYWLQVPFAAAARASDAATANPVWPYRIPSFLGALLAVCATYGLWRRIIGEASALLAAGMLAACLIVAVEAHIAKTDAALLGVTVCAMGLLGRAYLGPKPLRPEQALAFWLALGIGILIKGPITPMIAGLTALTLAVADRKRPGGPAWLRSLRFGWGIPVMLAVVLPWFIAIGIATHGAFFHDAIGGDLANKMRGGDDSHGAPPGVHLLLLPLLAFPASLFVLRALPGAWRDRTAPVTRFLLAWIVPSWLVFELTPTKLPHYTLPLYPALFLLTACWLLDPARAAPPRWMKRLSLIAFVGAAALLACGVAALPLVADPAGGAAQALGVPGFAAVALTAGAVLWYATRRRPFRAVAGGIAGAALVYWAVLGLELPRLSALFLSPRIEAALHAHWPDGRPPGSFGIAGYHEPSLVFLAGTDTRLLPTGWDAARFLAENPGAVAAVGDRDIPAFREEAARLGTAPRPVGRVDGFNYSNGRRTDLTLFVPR